jgi:ribose transport system ATP-binding protein
MAHSSPLVSMRNIVKTFPGAVALHDVDFELNAGEIHALLGENGAGKSTLIKIISGVYPPEGGRVAIRGSVIHAFTPHTARTLGIGTVYQGLSLAPQLTVTQNLFLGREQVHHEVTGWLNRPAMRNKAREALRQVGLDVDPDTPVEQLGLSHQQLIEIAKVLLLAAEILIMDEPTDKLTTREAGRLFELLRAMRRAGKGIIYITHKLEEIPEIADRVTVLRDGQRVATVRARETPIPQLIQMMVGRDLKEMFPTIASTLGDEVLRAEHLTVPGVLHDVSLTIRAGEIVGVAGLVGSGRTELAKALVGALPMTNGAVFFLGQRTRVRSPEIAVRRGIALLPEDRHREGLFMLLPVRENIVLPSLRSPWLNTRHMDALAAHFVDQLRIRVPSLQAPAMQLSGGNQQKVVLAKWLASRSKVFIFDEPTQGIDVGSKVEIYRLIAELAQAGAGILLISSELREILSLSHRVLVMWKGRLVGHFTRQEATPERVLAGIFGDTAAPA